MTRRKAASAWQGAASLPRGFFFDHTTIAWSPHNGRHHSAALDGHCGAFPHHDRRGNVLAQCRVRDREGGRVHDLRVPHQRRIDLRWRNLDPAAIDLLLHAPREKQIALLVEMAQIAGFEPTVVESLLVRFRIVLVASDHTRSANPDVADAAWRHG